MVDKQMRAGLALLVSALTVIVFSAASLGVDAQSPTNTPTPYRLALTPGGGIYFYCSTELISILPPGPGTALYRFRCATPILPTATPTSTPIAVTPTMPPTPTDTTVPSPTNIVINADFHLRLESPAIDRGVIIPGYHYPCPIEANGLYDPVAHPGCYCGTAPDLGAFEVCVPSAYYPSWTPTVQP